MENLSVELHFNQTECRRSATIRMLRKRHEISSTNIKYENIPINSKTSPRMLPAASEAILF